MGDDLDEVVRTPSQNAAHGLISSLQDVPVGNDLPQDGGITGRLPIQGGNTTELAGGSGREMPEDNSQYSSYDPSQLLAQNQNNNLNTARMDYENTVNMPIDKHTSKWKDIGAAIIQGADAFFNPGQGKKIEGYGKIKHDIAVDRAGARLAPLESLNQQRTADAFRTAQLGDILSKPAREEQEQQSRIDLQRMKNNAEGKKWVEKVRNGKYYKHFGDGREEPLLDAQNKQVVELTKLPIEVEIDGQKVYTTGDKKIDRQIAEDYRQASINLEVDKYNTTEANDYTEKLDKWATEEVKRGTEVTKLRSEGQGKLTQADQLQEQADSMNTTDDIGDPIPSMVTAKNSLLSQVAQLRREGAAQNRQADESKPLPKPSKPKASLSAPKLSGKTVPKSKDPAGLYQQ